MMNITLTFDNINEAMVALNAVKQFNGAVSDFTPAIEVTETVSNNTSDATVTTGDVQAIINKLVDMSADDLADKFNGNNKPYRVLKAYSMDRLKDMLGVNADAIPNLNIDDVNAAIDIIIRDVSDGGLSHDDMEDIFGDGVRTSAKIFNSFSLKEIVDTFKEENMI